MWRGVLGIGRQQTVQSMNFLQSPLLYALPLALLPIIIHLINQNRHRTVRWAAMMFLLDAKKMTKGIAQLRQILILTMRVLAVVALILAAARPLASGWLALTAGGEVDTVLVLLDRSASMEQQNLETGLSKRTTALEKLADMLDKTARSSRLVLIESAELEAVELEKPQDLLDLPQTEATDTAANIPAMLQRALDYLSQEQIGRTDVWLASDLRATDWQAASGQWASLRAAFSEVEGVNFFLLNYPAQAEDNLAISVSNLSRRRSPETVELVMDLSITGGPVDIDDSVTVPVELTINGARTATDMEVKGQQWQIQGHTIDLGTSEPTGWGRIDLPADSNVRDNSFFFVFDEAPTYRTVIVSDDSLTANAMRAAAAAPVQTGKSYQADILPVSQSAEVPWDETALLVWHADLPGEDDPEHALMQQYLESGRSLILLPPAAVSTAESFLGFQWQEGVLRATADSPLEIGWWRTDSGLLANTQNGNPLPLGKTQLYQVQRYAGESQPFLKLADETPVVSKLITAQQRGACYIWATLPRSSHSSLASDGVAFFAMLHRALAEGAEALGNAQQRDAGMSSLPKPVSGGGWTPVSTALNSSGELQGGAFRAADRWLALNRPATEDDLRTIDADVIAGLFSGLEYRIIEDRVDNRSSLASEIWRAFLITMAIALVLEALLCLPPKPEPDSDSQSQTTLSSTT